jgi:hypothetical protein
MKKEIELPNKRKFDDCGTGDALVRTWGAKQLVG